jgi:two-component system chemotaxis response regulator CheB
VNARAFDVVALAASAGGLNALSRVLSVLPADFAAGLVVVQHIDPHHRSMMAEILGRCSAIRVTQAAEGDAIEQRHAYIAPPDRHLLVNPDHTLSLSRTELVHFVRPSADLLFESVAAAYRARAIAVVLSGSGRDGANGVKAIKQMGGTVIVQDENSQFKGMPNAARHAVTADYVLPLDDIAPRLCALVAA